MGIIDPAANHVKEVYRNGKVQALLSPSDEKPQAKSTCERVQNERHHWEATMCCWKAKHLITEYLVKGSTGLYQTINTSQPQTQEAVVDGLHQNNLRQDEDRIPDVAAEMTGHLAVDVRDKTRPRADSTGGLKLVWRYGPEHDNPVLWPRVVLTGQGLVKR